VLVVGERIALVCGDSIDVASGLTFTWRRFKVPAHPRATNLAVVGAEHERPGLDPADASTYCFFGARGDRGAAEVTA
jgi:hypothetical protein